MHAGRDDELFRRGGLFDGFHGIWNRFKWLALVSVELFLDCRLSIAPIGISGELSVAGLTNSQDGRVSYAFHNPQTAIWHGASFPQTLSD
jgi:hypothetical protein